MRVYLCELLRVMYLLHILTFHSSEKPKWALSQFLAAFVSVDYDRECVFVSRENECTVCNETFPFCSIHLWDIYRICFRAVSMSFQTNKWTNLPSCAVAILRYMQTPCLLPAPARFAVTVPLLICTLLIYGVWREIYPIRFSLRQIDYFEPVIHIWEMKWSALKNFVECGFKII